MKVTSPCICLVALLWTHSSSAGGVLEMSMAADGESAAVVMERIWAQDGNLRIDTLDGRGGISMSVIFKNSELIQLGHADRSYTRMNEDTFKQLLAKSGAASANMAGAANEMAAAMQQMEQQLANLPPEQRAMVEEMMKKNMPQLARMPGAGNQAPEIQVQKQGMDRWRDYRCTRYRVQLDANNHYELCAADIGQINGGRDVRQAFDGMRTFHQKMLEALPAMPLGNPLANLPAVLGEIEGFPVYRREFNQNRLLGERFLTSDQERDLEDSVFAVPEGYQEQSLGI